MTEKTVGFSYGALMPTLEEQASEQGFTLGNKADNFEKLRESISWLTFHNILTDSQINMAYKKLQKQVVKSLKPLKKKEG